MRPILASPGASDARLAWAGADGPALPADAVGVIQTVGDGVDPALVGARVVAGGDIWCGACDACKGALPAHCSHPSRPGVDLPGALSDVFAGPERWLARVPDGVGDERAVLAPLLGAALHAAASAAAAGRGWATVIGDSPFGLLVAQCMARVDPSVRVLGDRPDRAAICERWNVKHRATPEAGRRRDQAVVVETTGSPQALDLALELVRPRGAIVLTGPQESGNGLAPWRDRITRDEVRLIGCRGGTAHDGVRALARTDLGPILGRRFKLADAPAALALARDPGALRVVVEF